MGDTTKPRKPRNKDSSEQSKVPEKPGLDTPIVKSGPKSRKAHSITDEDKQKMKESILAQIADGIPLRQICREENMPNWGTVYDWLAADSAFATRFAHARELGEDAISQDCMDIADDGTNDWMERLDVEGRSIGWQINGEHVQRSKLRIETRLKLLSKWNPKKWGDRQTVDMNVTNPVADRLARARKRNAG